MTAKAPATLCAIEDCAELARARGWCMPHYHRWHSYGDPLWKKPALPTTCSVEGCDRPRLSAGLCGAHGSRVRHLGDVQADKPIQLRGRHSERFWGRVDKSGDCWIYTGHLTTGYGLFPIGKSGVVAHRFAYEDLVGPIPVGLTLDHVCHSTDLSCRGGVTCPHRACVNPAHLEPVTQAENNRRARRPRARKSA